MFYEEYLEKVAAAKKKSNASKGIFDAQAEEERDLISKYQNAKSPFEKNMFLNRLKIAYRGPINNAISSSGLTSIMDFADAQQVAENAITHIFDKFDLSSDVMPKTYIIGNLDHEMKRERYNERDNTSRKSSELTRKSEYIKVADPILTMQLGRKPNNQELFNYITKDMGKSLTMGNIERIQKLDRTTRSGNQQIGGQNDSSAEVMTLMDMKNKSQSPEEYLKMQNEQNQIDNILDANFQRPERRLIRMYYGFGKFKGNPVNLNKAWLNAGLTSYYEAKKVIERFEQLLEQQGLL